MAIESGGDQWIAISWGRMNSTMMNEFSCHLLKTPLFIFFFLPHHLGFFSLFFNFLPHVLHVFLFLSSSLPFYFLCFLHALAFYSFFFHPPLVFKFFLWLLTLFFFHFRPMFSPFFFCSQPPIFRLSSFCPFFTPSTNIFLLFLLSFFFFFPHLPLFLLPFHALPSHAFLGDQKNLNTIGHYVLDGDQNSLVTQEVKWGMNCFFPKMIAHAPPFSIAIQ